MGNAWSPAHTLDMDEQIKQAWEERTEDIVRRFNLKVNQIMEEAREDIVATLREPRVIFY